MLTFIGFCCQPDTLAVIDVTQRDVSWFDLKTLLAVVIGGLIAIAGNAFIAYIQRKSDFKRAFFDHHLAAYKEFSSICSKTATVRITASDAQANIAYPMAYQNIASLKSWLNQAVESLDRQNLFIDTETRTAFQKLNAIIINDIQSLSVGQFADIDLSTRDLGRQHRGEIISTTDSVLKSCRNYLKSTYGLPVPLL